MGWWRNVKCGAYIVNSYHHYENKDHLRSFIDEVLVLGNRGNWAVGGEYYNRTLNSLLYVMYHAKTREELVYSLWLMGSIRDTYIERLESRSNSIIHVAIKNVADKLKEVVPKEVYTPILCYYLGNGGWD